MDGKRESKGGRSSGRRVIDFHVHMPYWIRDPVKACKRLRLEEELAGAEKAVVIGVDADLDAILGSVTPKLVSEAALEDFDLLAFQSISYINRMVVEPEKFIAEMANDFPRHRRGLEDLLGCLEADPGFFHIVVSSRPGREEAIAGAVRRRPEILGVKIFPTFHLTRPDSRRLDPIYRALADTGGLAVVHTGCDPGPWELTRLCRNANPRYVAEAARRHRDVTFIVAHLGSYSALKPGIFFREALEALTLDNIYADTSAADPFYVSLAVREGMEDKLLFGSDYPYVAGYTVLEAVREIESLGLESKVIEKIFSRNAEKLLKTAARRAI